MELNNNGGPQRGMIMEPVTPADCADEPLASFLSALLQGAYLPGEAAQHAYLLNQLGGVPGGPSQPLRYQSRWCCLCGGPEHVQRDDGGDI